MIASAYDERIAAVISSSSGALGVLPMRFFSEQHFGEGIELITRVFPEWFHPRIRFFTGREDRLPVDMHELVALSAPRCCLLSTALNDPVETTWAMQQTFLAVERVYRFLGTEENLSVMWRPGGHETYTEVIESYLDWCDAGFGKTRQKTTTRFIYPVNRRAFESRYTADKATGPRQLVDPGLGDCISIKEWQKVKQDIRGWASMLLGQAPPKANNPGHDYGVEADHVALLLEHRADQENIRKEQIVFGDYINADIYRAARLTHGNQKSPAILWLPPFSLANGYRAAYYHGEQIYSRLAREGFVVFCYEPIGMGRRVEEAGRFYERYPGWSLMGKMVSDASSALEAIKRLPYVDADQVFEVGYGLGSHVGLYLSAIETSLAGFAAIGLPQPYQAVSDGSTGGIRQWYDHFMLLPRLENFDRQKNYDIPSLLACFAPRPFLAASPLLDRETPVADTIWSVDTARHIYGLFEAGRQLEHVILEDYNRFSLKTLDRVVNWLNRVKAEGSEI